MPWRWAGSPGPADTPRLRRIVAAVAEERGVPFEEVWQGYLDANSLGRLPTVDEIAWAVMLLLEPEALRRSVRRGAPWDAASDALTRADEATDTAERSLANREFHRALYVPCGNPLLGRMLDEVRDQAALVSAVAWAADPSWEREATEHREILRLALDGDADGAAAALYAHIASFVERAFPGAREEQKAQ